MVAIAEPTPAMQAGAEQLLADPSRWTSARRKSDGRAFWIVVGRTGTYYTTADACTCPGWQRRHLCSHSLAATMREARVIRLPRWRRTRHGRPLASGGRGARGALQEGSPPLPASCTL